MGAKRPGSARPLGGEASKRAIGPAGAKGPLDDFWIVLDMDRAAGARWGR